MVGTYTDATEQAPPMSLCRRSVASWYRRPLLLAALLAAGSVQADLANYPFRVSTEPLSDGHRVLAINSGDAPVSVSLTLFGENLGLDGPAAQRFVVPPRTSLRVARSFPFDPRRPYQVEQQVRFRVGDERATPDGAAVRLPFGDGQEVQIAPPQRRHAVAFTVPSGTPVLATRAGKVIDLDARGVILLHSDGTYARYFNLVPDERLRVGQTLTAGAPVGMAGEGGQPVEFAVQRTLPGTDGPKAEALPVAFFAYVPPAAVAVIPGEKIVADYSHPYVPPPAPEPKAASTPPPPSPQSARDVDRDTVQRAYAAQFGRPQSQPATPWYQPAVRLWRRGAATGAEIAGTGADFLRSPPQLGPVAALGAGLGVLALGLVVLWPVARRLRRDQELDVLGG